MRGKVAFDNSALEDFVIARGDGSVLFLLANVVDDIRQGITHVDPGRGAPVEHAEAATAVGGVGPRAARLGAPAVIVNEKRQKLSKRRDKVALEDFRDEGYLARAIATT